MTKFKRIFHKEELAFEVCPWVYYSCNLPAGEVCQLSNRLQKVKDIIDWQKQAKRALNCKHLGYSLTREQYENRRTGVVV